MNAQKTFQLNREKFVIGALLACSILNGFTGVLFILFLSRRVSGLFYLFAALFAFSLAFWAENTPYMRVTSAGIQSFRFPFIPPVCISWKQIKDIRRKKNRAELILENHKKKKIKINVGKRKERERFIEVLEESLQQMKYMKSIKCLLEDVKSGRLLPEAMFQEIELDAILARRDTDPFDSLWIEAST